MSHFISEKVLNDLSNKAMKNGKATCETPRGYVFVRIDPRDERIHVIYADKTNRGTRDNFKMFDDKFYSIYTAIDSVVDFHYACLRDERS